MKYTDLATRLEDLDNRLTRNERESTTCTSEILRLEAKLSTARERNRKIRAARLALLDQRDRAKSELNVRLG